EFLNAKAKSDPNGLYNTTMGSPAAWGGPFITRSGTDGDYTYTAVSGKENQPVRLVSFFDAMRFANWMENGQGTGDTEDGSYDLSLGTYAVREPGSSWVIPAQDEWYKAAYYSASNSLYYDYPNGSDLVPDEPTNGTSPRVFNFGDTPFWDGTVVFTSTGDTTGRSPYGTYDQGGNVEEWLETFAAPDQSVRGLRGGHFSSLAGPLSANSFGSSHQPQVEGDGFGFRLVFVIPEPRTILLLLGALPVLLWLKRL
ncbi:MAG: SUMF1/EgtB/PvdO family nonheme iron enzyme, partial [Thermoleophilia bacterium]|nr:SUMF1/EgtB/PvdO family nonheme iron enzyme [Thermoleophilia bacterium]